MMPIVSLLVEPPVALTPVAPQGTATWAPLQLSLSNELIPDKNGQSCCIGLWMATHLNYIA